MVDTKPSCRVRGTVTRGSDRVAALWAVGCGEMDGGQPRGCEADDLNSMHAVVPWCM